MVGVLLCLERLRLRRRSGSRAERATPPPAHHARDNSQALHRLTVDLHERDLPVVAGFATHPDWDHALWHPLLGAAPRYGTARCAARLVELRSPPDWKSAFIEGLPPEIVDDVPVGLFGLLTGLPDGATRLPWDGPETRVIEHPAHAPGHAALLVTERGALMAGDMLSDVLVPMFDEPDGANDPLEEYLVGLQQLESVIDDVDVVIPGHGSPGDQAEMRRRIDLDREYVRALHDGDPSDDPRIGPDAQPGWEWVTSIHDGQQATFGKR
ncbi:MBL fold metallo-hydrolase [Microbacterium murale]|uniref:Glyoxylase-like metal-dependent hydrolase (Beta-lactamase superfamily II) n=1 Tax=Microbacterium murale TaxID=1081040 RepID=A0ABU0P9T9_9MICO|nr:MBL fold metallo-hydrolase [Microbacterium murale]MDQ0644102.1 glyoxylase-like metal-dependent hydrolase (beta-lactamase superfamily II) [Microbacterium murale]